MLKHTDSEKHKMAALSKWQCLLVLFTTDLTFKNFFFLMVFIGHNSDPVLQSSFLCFRFIRSNQGVSESGFLPLGSKEGRTSKLTEAVDRIWTLVVVSHLTS